MTSTDLYRHFDTSGALLYVGISLSAVQRLAQHKHQAGWKDQIATVEVEKYPSRYMALIAEYMAIERFKPKWNIAHCKPKRQNIDVGFCVRHKPTGFRDGWYFCEFDAVDMLWHWKEKHPAMELDMKQVGVRDPIGDEFMADRLPQWLKRNEAQTSCTLCGAAGHRASQCKWGQQ